MGKFRQILTALSAHDRSIFSFPNDNFSKYQGIFTKLAVFIDIVEICFGIAGRQISSIFDSYLSVFSFLDDNFTKYQWIFTKLGMCIDIVDICFGIANGRISSIFDRVICPQHIHILLSGQ